MEKLEIIDLLNGIANKWDIPKTIKYKDKIWKYDIKSQDYCDISGKMLFGYLFDYIKTSEFLNDEVEAVEHNWRIAYPVLHKTAPNEATGDETPNWRYLIDSNFEHLNKTIYQLIDEVNKLNEKMLMAYDSEEVVESNE